MPRLLPRGLRARLDGALAWACLQGNQSQPQATEIQRLGAQAASKQPLNGNGQMEWKMERRKEIACLAS